MFYIHNDTIISDQSHFFPVLGSQLSMTEPKYLNTFNLREGLFWQTILEFSIHKQLSLFHRPEARPNIMNVLAVEASSLFMASKQKETEGRNVWDSIILFKGISPGAYIFHLVPTY